MPRPCTICNHLNRAAVDEALRRAIPLRTIAAQYTVGKTSLLRHQRHGETDHGANHPAAPLPPCPCHRINWRGLALDAHRVQEYLGTVQDPAHALPLLRYALALFVTLVESARDPGDPAPLAYAHTPRLTDGCPASVSNGTLSQ